MSIIIYAKVKRFLYMKLDLNPDMQFDKYIPHFVFKPFEISKPYI